jgi:norsolorinic acid ketoreductase
VIANAGISEHYAPASSTSLDQVRSHFEVNSVGVLALFQAVLPLLQKSSRPMFVALSTAVASIGAMENIPVESTAYGMSKVALNYMVKRIHVENKDLISFVISPGWVQTEMGQAGAAASGLEEAPVKLEDSIKGMLEKVGFIFLFSLSSRPPRLFVPPYLKRCQYPG